MQKIWTNRNVDLEQLAEKTMEFLKENDFDVVTNRTESGYHFLAKSSPYYTINGQALITIKGKPEEFSITIELQRRESRILSLPIIFTSFLGGGSLITQHFKSEEKWRELERDLWRSIEGIIIHLDGTSQISKE